jgi:hypothetical protein
MLEAAGTQRIDYRQEERAICLVRIAQALKRFRDLTSVTMVRLGPSSAAEQIGPLLDDASFVCTCQTLRGAVELEPQRIPVRPIKGALFVQLQGIASGELVRIKISVGGRTWRSSYESVDTVDIQVKE